MDIATLQSLSPAQLDVRDTELIGVLVQPLPSDEQEMVRRLVHSFAFRASSPDNKPNALLAELNAIRDIKVNRTLAKAQKASADSKTAR